MVCVRPNPSSENPSKSSFCPPYRTKKLNSARWLADRSVALLLLIAAFAASSVVPAPVSRIIHELQDGHHWPNLEEPLLPFALFHASRHFIDPPLLIAKREN